MIAVIIVAVCSIAVFLLVFWLLGVVSAAKKAIDLTRGAVHTMRAPDLDELDRERAVQRAALSLVVVSASLVVRSLLALIAAVIPILAADWAGIVPRTTTFTFMERWDVIVVATVVITAGFVVGRRFWKR